MKVAPTLSVGFVAAMVLAFCCGAHRAETPAASGSVATLTQAYEALSAADHDYQGHRRKAMGAIEQAVKELGGTIKGDGRGHEPQGESDAQLHKAQQLLETVNGSPAGKHPRASKHIQHAISELSIALSIK